jgi:glycosyltransferase involved in cell wall biosynthesis
VKTVHVVLPQGIDDPARRSGGNVYDRRACDGLRGLGWQVREHTVPGAWPSPNAELHAPLSDVVSGLDDGTVVLVDGLVASGAPDVLVPQSSRLRLVVLVHLPLGVDASSATVPTDERAVLSAATAVVTTSDWTRRWLLATYGLEAPRVHVAEPGVDEAEPAPGTSDGGALLCVAAVAPHKGHDVLLAALRGIPDLPWRCVCVGSTTRAPQFAETLARDAASAGLAGRFVLAGHRVGPELDSCYAGADVLVLPSRTETYGLVVTEALARGLPVIASDVGGVRQALGDDGSGGLPGLLVPPEDRAALAAALRRWLGQPGLRSALRESAAARRSTLPRWAATAETISRVLEPCA